MKVLSSVGAEELDSVLIICSQGQINRRSTGKNKLVEKNKEKEKEQGGKQRKTVPGIEQRTKKKAFFFSGPSFLAEFVLLYICLPPWILRSFFSFEQKIQPVDFMFKRDYAREDYPAQGMGEQKDQQPLEASTPAEISQRNDFIAQGHGKYSSCFAVSQIIIFSGDILFFHDSVSLL